MYDDTNLPGNPYAPEYFGDTEGTGAQASMAVAYEIRTLTLALLAAHSPIPAPKVSQEIRERLGWETDTK